ncbi:MAG: hypothetical protein A2X86_05285 [Bdellovibrionales bacterium GWA2_49_15]|nr:MAG: hypothetical protein A2X86_05285 [Bdellovibrionales bacterium GWA2_49_15]
MKLFHDGISPFVVAKLTIGRIAGIALVAVGAFLTLHILSTEKEMSTLRREQVQLEKMQNKLNLFIKPESLMTLSSRDVKALDQMMNDRSIKSLTELKTLQTSLSKYHEYLNGRGDMSTFTALMDDINADVSGINDKLATIFSSLKGPEAVIAFSAIKRSFENIKKSIEKTKDMSVGHDQYISIGEIITSVKEIHKTMSQDKGRVLEKAARDHRTQLVGPIEFLIDKLNTIQNKNSFVASQIPTIFSLSSQIATVQERLTDMVGVQSAYIRLGHEHITQVAVMLALVLFGMTFFAFARMFARQKVQGTLTAPAPTSEMVIPASVRPESNLIRGSTLNQFLAENMATATAVTDANENITWANSSFYQTLGLDPSRSYNWNQLLESHIVRSNSALGIEGAVSVLGRPGKELKLASKTPKTSAHANEKRLLEFVPIYSYQAEMQKTMARLAPFTEIPGVDIYEAGETVSEVSSEISYLFQTTDTILKVEDERPIYIAFDKVLMRKNLKTFMTGLVIYLAQAKANRLTVKYQKVGDVFSMSFAIPGHKFREVTAPLVFRDKTYPSLSAYLEQIESSFQKYGARITLKNVQKDGQDEAVIEWELTESDDALFNLQTLEKRRRVHRVVKTAEKVKDSQASTTTKENNRKQSSTLGPKDFQ